MLLKGFAFFVWKKKKRNVGTYDTNKDGLLCKLCNRREDVCVCCLFDLVKTGEDWGPLGQVRGVVSRLDAKR
jgi:hypothetical protein